jgi:hypothetical protein
VRSAAALALVGVACRCPPSPATPISEPRPSASPSASAASPPPIASTAPSAAPPLLPDGCYSEVASDLAPRDRLDALATHCVAGMDPVLGDPAVRAIAPGERYEIPLAVDDPARCLRVIAAADAGVADVELSLLDPAGRSLAADELPGSFALVGTRGPVCPAAPGPHRVVVVVRGRRADVAVQVWRAR